MPHTRVLRPRLLSVITYLLLGGAGVAFLFWQPSQALHAMMGTIKFVVWNVFLMAGSVVGVAGAWKKIYRLELVALPFVGTGVLVYGVTLIPRLGESNSPGTLLGITFFIFATVTELGGRGWELVRVILISNRLRRRLQDE